MAIRNWIFTATSWSESIKDKLEILRPLEKQLYGDWEFEVKDLNGYVLVFSELIE